MRCSNYFSRYLKGLYLSLWISVMTFWLLQFCISQVYPLLDCTKIIRNIPKVGFSVILSMWLHSHMQLQTQANESELCFLANSLFSALSWGGSNSDDVSTNRWDRSCLTLSKSYRNYGEKIYPLFSKWERRSHVAVELHFTTNEVQGEKLALLHVCLWLCFATSSSCVDIYSLTNKSFEMKFSVKVGCKAM